MKETIEEMMKRIAIENDFEGENIDGYDFEGCTPSIRIELTDEKIWEASLTSTFCGNSTSCSFCSKEYILKAIADGKTALDALIKLDSLCKNNRKSGAILCLIDED